MTPTSNTGPKHRASGRGVAWWAGLVVAAGAAVATAHGLFEVAAASGVPAGIAWLYPIITDGLALVAYAATARLSGPGRRYAWTVVVLAAGLSGLAQATYLAGSVHAAVGPVRFGVGAWPAVAAAIAAHLLFLLGSRRPDAVGALDAPADVEPPPYSDVRTTELYDSVQPDLYTASKPEPYEIERRTPDAGRRTANTDPEPVEATVEYRTAPEPEQPVAESPPASAGERARAAAREHHERHGRLPTVSELMRLAEVARGTAGTALKQLRDERPNLHIVTTTTEASSQP